MKDKEKLIRKYFIQQKIIEILAIPVIVFVPLYLGRFLFKVYSLKNQCLPWIFGFIHIIILYSIISINYLIAKDRAENKIKKMEKNEKR